MSQPPDVQFIMPFIMCSSFPVSFVAALGFDIVVSNPLLLGSSEDERDRLHRRSGACTQSPGAQACKMGIAPENRDLGVKTEESAGKRL
jgi:hypothetical protein